MSAQPAPKKRNKGGHPAGPAVFNFPRPAPGKSPSATISAAALRLLEANSMPGEYFAIVRDGDKLRLVPVDLPAGALKVVRVRRRSQSAGAYLAIGYHEVGVPEGTQLAGEWKDGALEFAVPAANKSGGTGA